MSAAMPAEAPDVKANGASRTSQWMDLLKRAEEDEAAREVPTAEIDFGDGFTALCRRYDFQTAIKAHILPTPILKFMMEARPGQTQEVAKLGMSHEDTLRGLKFQRDAVCSTLVEPRIVDEMRILREGEIYYHDLCKSRPDIVDAIAGWVMRGCPGVPVETAAGEVTHDSVKNFRAPAKRRHVRPTRSRRKAKKAVGESTDGASS